MSYLKHKDTGEVFPTNENLLKRGDMIPCNLDGSLIDSSPTAAEPEKPKARKPRAKKEEADGAVVDDLSDFDLGEE